MLAAFATVHVLLLIFSIAIIGSSTFDLGFGASTLFSLSLLAAGCCSFNSFVYSPIIEDKFHVAFLCSEGGYFCLILNNPVLF
jgi:hypothetical protein